MMAPMINRLSSRYCTIPTAIVIDNNLSANAKLLYIYLASLDDCAMDDEKIMKSVGIKDEAELYELYTELETSAWLEKSQKPEGDGYYYDLMDKLV